MNDLKLDKDFLLNVAHIADMAGRLIMKYFQKSFDQDRKQDGSIVTTADKEADKLITTKLKILTSSFPIISEEGVHEKIDENRYFWLVDPLDGTNQFVHGKNEFTVNIALIHKRQPILGIINHPPSQKTYAAFDDHLFIGHGVDLKEVESMDYPIEETVIIGSRHELGDDFEAILAQHGMKEKSLIIIPSSLKFCAMVEGRGSFQYRGRPSSEWDIAAGHALIAARGGKIHTLVGEDLLYGKKCFENPGFVAFLPK